MNITMSENDFSINAIHIIYEDYQRYVPVMNPLDKLFEYPFKIDSPYHLYNWFLNQFTDFSLKMALIEFMKDKSIHVEYNNTFAQLMTMIITIVENRPQKEEKEEMKQRLIIKLRESDTGSIHYMMVALVDFYQQDCQTKT